MSSRSRMNKDGGGEVQSEEGKEGLLVRESERVGRNPTG